MSEVKSLTPFSSSRQLSRRRENMDPFLALHRQMSNVFDDLFRGFGLPSSSMAQTATPTVLAPRINVSETQDAIQIAAEMPGISPDDVEVTITDDVLTIRGETQMERKEDDENRDYHLVERVEGTFARSLQLPFNVDPSAVQAEFKNGVLTLTIPKPREVQERTHRIAVQSGDEQAKAGSDGSQKKPRIDRAAAGDKPVSTSAEASSSGQTGSAEASASNKSSGAKAS